MMAGLSRPPEKASAKRHVTASASCSVGLRNRSRARKERGKTDSVNVSPAPSYLEEFYRETWSIPALAGRRSGPMCLSLAIGPACKAPAVPVLDSYTADGGLSALHAV